MSVLTRRPMTRKHLLHRRRAADDRQRSSGIGGRAAPPDAALRQGAVDRGHQHVEVERLRQVFERAALVGADRGQDGVLRAHHDDRQIGPALLDARAPRSRPLPSGISTSVTTRSPSPAIDPLPQRASIRGGAHRVAALGQGLAHHQADGTIVVGDQMVAS
jgi:hypothetical protein